MPVRVGVIGAGNMGADHVQTLQRKVSGGEVGLIADVDLARTRLVAAMVPGARATDDSYALIADPRVDAVIIASHDSTHADLIVSAVRGSKPVMCENPLATTVSECIARCIDAGRRESSVRPLAESIATLEVLDEIRRQIGVVFDEES